MPSLRTLVTARAAGALPGSLVAVALAAAAVAACSAGVTRPPPDVAQAMEDMAADSGAEPAPAVDGAAPAQVGDAGAGAAAVTPDLAPTKLAGDLTALGLDPKKLPPLGKLEPDKMRKVMKLMSSSLGVQCTHCHDGDDFHKQTPHKRVAERMWNEWVRGYVQASDGAPVFCDSCHQGKAKFLDKSDHKALAGWMKTNFVEKLKKVDGKENACATCHGDPFDGDFLDTWEKK